MLIILHFIIDSFNLVKMEVSIYQCFRASLIGQLKRRCATFLKIWIIDALPLVQVFSWTCTRSVPHIGTARCSTRTDTAKYTDLISKTISLTQKKHRAYARQPHARITVATRIRRPRFTGRCGQTPWAGSWRGWCCRHGLRTHGGLQATFVKHHFNAKHFNDCKWKTYQKQAGLYWGSLYSPKKFISNLPYPSPFKQIATECCCCCMHWNRPWFVY